MSSAAALDTADALRVSLARLGSGRVAQLARVSKRTAQRWIEGATKPGADDLLRLMRDGDLAAEMLRLAGHAELAKRLRALQHLEAALREIAA